MKRKSSQRPLRKDLEALCGQPGPEDGLDPRVYFRPHSNRRNSRKDLQLCRQVAETLNYVLSGQSHDECLCGLNVVSVQPAPDAHRLMVTVCPFAPERDFSPVLVLERLQQSVGRLRAEVARSISRRKVPDLVFRVAMDDMPSRSETEVSDGQ